MRRFCQAMAGICGLTAKINHLSTALFFALLFFGTLAHAVTFTSVQSGDWSDGNTWDQGGSTPGAGDDVIISDGHLVTLQAGESCTNFTINSGGNFDYNGFTLSVSNNVVPFISVQTGDYSTNGSWLNPNSDGSPGASDRVIIIKGHTVTANNDDADDLTVSAGAVLDTDNNKDMTVSSNLVVDGTVVLNSSNADLIIDGAASISGSGTIDGSDPSGALNIDANATIASDADLTLLGNLEIANNIVLTNNGSVTLSGGSVTGGNGSSQLTMGTDSRLEVDGALLATGILDASTNAGNTVSYYGAVAQTVKSPSGNSYTNLDISGTGTTTFPANALTILGDFTVSGGTLDVNNQNIDIEGDWENSATINNLAAVTFDGSGDQTVSTNATDFPNLTINKSGGDLILNEDVTVTTSGGGILTLTQGNIDTNGHSLILGSSADGEGTPTFTSGRVIGTFGQYISSIASNFTFPIGTSANDRTTVLSFDGISVAGTVLLTFVETNPGTFSPRPLVDDIDVYNAFNEGYWSLSGDLTLGGNTYDITLTGDGFSSFAIDANTRIVTRTDNLSNWMIDGSHNVVSGNDASRNNVGTFGAEFAFADDTDCTAPSDPSISGTTDVCTSDVNEVYSVTLNSGNDYSWTVVGGTIDGYGTSTGFVTDLNTITVDWGSTGQVGSVSVQEGNTCTVSNNVTQDIQINSIPPSNLSGNVFVPEGATGISYSVDNEANTTYTWTITGDGTQASGGSTSSITVDWGSNGTGGVSVTATKTSPSCAASTATTLDVSIYVVVNSNGTGGGAWGTTSTWETGTVPLNTESARIVSGDAVTMPNSDTEITNLIVNGTLTLDNNRDLDVTGDMVINSGGTLTSTGGLLIMSGTATSPSNSIDGTGDLANVTINITNASKTIASSAVIGSTGTNTIDIAGGLTVTNNGSIEIGGDLAGTGQWTNSTNSTLTFLSNPAFGGTLLATASGNTVRYSAAGGASILNLTGGYQNLETDGNATLTAGTDVNEDFTLTSGTFDMASFDMNVAGGLVYTAGTITNGGAFVLDGTANQAISGFTSLPNLIINNTLDGADAVTLGNSLNIAGTLTLTDGIVGNGSNTITITNTSTGAVSGGSADSFINGVLARVTASTSIYDFPVGSGTTYKLVGLTPQNGTGETFLVQGFQTAYSDIANMTGLTNVSSLEYWEISKEAGGVDDDALVRLWWNTRTASGISNVAELLIGHYTGGQWTNAGVVTNSGDSDPGYLETTTFQTFSPFTFASNSGGSNPLPVEFTSFKGTWRDGAVLLQWGTATEINNERFVIERSRDGVNFGSLGSVWGHGTTNEAQAYQFIDNNPFGGVSYYRLRQIDFDGQTEHSAIISIQDDSGEPVFGVVLEHASVGNQELRLRMQTTDFDSPVHMTLWSVHGEILFDADIEEPLTEDLVRIPYIINTHRSGLYLLRAAQGSNQVIIKFSSR